MSESLDRTVPVATPAPDATSAGGVSGPIGAGTDPVIADLRDAESNYIALKERAALQEAELIVIRSELSAAEKRELSLAVTAEERLLQVEHEREKAEHERIRADELRRLLRDVHKSMFGGNVYDMILRACLKITGATKGLYVTAHGGNEGRLRVRAAVDVDGYPNSPPSPFIDALCRKVLREEKTFVCNDAASWGDLPTAERDDERFQNCIITPSVLMKDVDGIVIAGDKLDGQFSPDDVETLLSVGDSASVAVQNSRLERELQLAYLSTVSTLADAVEAKDPHTHGHCEQVSRYARLIAARVQLTDEERQIICYAALLHDVGKIGVSDGVLHKPGPLLPEERALVRAHVRVGHDLINNVPALAPVAKVVLHHHEWYDGNGYPDNLAGESIPIASRIVAVVDSYCAMITRRSYKEAYTLEHARSELELFSGTQFDPQIVRIFLDVLESGTADDIDEDHDAECGVLPGFGRLTNMLGKQ